MLQEESVIMRVQTLAINLTLGLITNEEQQELNLLTINDEGLRIIKEQVIRELHSVDNQNESEVNAIFEEAERRRRARWTLKFWVNYGMNKAGKFLSWVKRHCLPD